MTARRAIAVSCSLALRSRSTVPAWLLAGLAGMAMAVATVATERAALARPDSAAVGASAGDVMPIRRIVLYRSGVGYFQRAGTVTDNAKVQLKFDATQINDVLKSLQVLDRSGGRVDSVSYASKDPLARRLASFGLQIGDNPSMASLLERLRGSVVTITTTDGSVSGTVLSVETRKVPAAGAKGNDEGALVDTAFLNLVTSKGITSVALPTVRDFTIADPQLAEELTRALGALADSRAERTKTVDLTLSGGGARDIVAAYVHETPVWKTSYRLLLPEGEAPAGAGAGGDAKSSSSILQGWAIVENTTDSDWKDVKLALVSGRPVSFQMDLYEPLYTYRPMVAVPTVPGVMPRAYEGGTAASNALAGFGGFDDKAKDAEGLSLRLTAVGRANNSEGLARTMAKSSAMPASPAPATAADFSGVSAQDLADYASKPVAQAGEVGEQFQFELGAPVTIERQRSAMLPILSAPVGGKRVSIYNMADRADHPMRGVELINSSDLQLLPGPISVYDGAAYAGDAQIGQVSIGDKRLLAYAVDLDVNVITTPSEETNVTAIKIVQGSFQMTVKRKSGMKYQFDNKDLKRSRTIVVEHPKKYGWELVSPGKDNTPEQTQSMYRFSVSAEPGKQGVLDVVQERVDQQSAGIDYWDLDTLVKYQAQGRVSEGVLQAIREIGKLRAAVNDADRDVAQTDQALSTLRSEQQRISSMINSLDRQTDAYKKLLSKINTQEAEIDRLSTIRLSQSEAANTARVTLNSYVQNLNVE